MDKNSKIYVAGHLGMLGSCIVRCLEQNGYRNLVLRTSRELDLTRQDQVESFFNTEKPDYVFLAAARVGGILANNTYPADFIYINLQIEADIIHMSWKTGVKKLLFFASSCNYPRDCPQPMKEEMLWTGPLEPTNAPYAAAKLAGIIMCEAYNRQHGTNFISVIPTNLYGPNDNFDPVQSHVSAGLIARFHQAKLQNLPTVTVWGTGTPRRELMYADDVAEASLFLMKQDHQTGPFNVGTGQDCSILELARLIKKVVGYRGEIVLDPSKPDGAPRKLLDVSRINALGWKARVGLEEGMTLAYQWYLESGGQRTRGHGANTLHAS